MAEIDSGYWEWHFLWVLYWPYIFIFLGLFSLVESTAFEMILYPMSVGVFVLVVAALGALIGYVVEARQLRETDSDWIPNPWAYGLGHVLLSPAIVAPIYLYQRRKHIGIPWEEARTVRLLRGLAALPRSVARQVRSPR